jgi:hypothetical protein
MVISNRYAMSGRPALAREMEPHSAVHTGAVMVQKTPIFLAACR